METLWQDFRYGFRSLRRSPVLIVVAVLSLAIGIAANTTIFSAVDVFLLQPLPYPEPDELHAVYNTNEARGWTEVDPSIPDFLDYRERSRTLLVAASDGRSFNVSGGDRPERLDGSTVSSNFFTVLGVQPALGRSFTAEEELEGRHRVVIISDGLWHRRFGADPGVLGSTMLLDSETYTVVGVMPPRFWYEDVGVDLWVPFGLSGDESRGSRGVEVLARLAQGSTPDQARQEIERIAAELEGEYPGSNQEIGARLVRLHEAIFDEGYRTGSLIATVAVFFLLLIACANVANLLLTHAADRDREVAVRGALGAGRTRIVRQFLAEALTISLLGGLTGLGLSIVGIEALVSVFPAWIPRADEIGLNTRALAFTTGVTVLTALIIGVAPALQGVRADIMATLREGGRGGTAVTSVRLRKALVVGEVALALVLVISSVLLVRGFANVRLADLGFDDSDVLALRVTLPASEYSDTASVAAFQTSFAERIAALPGVQSVGATTILPLHGNSSTTYNLPGDEAKDLADRRIAQFRYVTPGYFAALDIPVLRGRNFTEADRAGSPRVVLINEKLAERHWPDGDPVGQKINFFTGPRRIVGVVANTQDVEPGQPVGPRIYFPTTQGVQRSLSWVIEASVLPTTLAEPARGQLRQLDPNLPAYGMQPLAEAIGIQISGDAIMAKIMIAVAVIALVLALAGIYAVMGYTVSRRTRELGIRLALGARSRDVVGMVVRQGAVLAAIGVVLGIGIALAVSRTLSIFLFGVSPFDPLTFSSVAATLLAAAIAATYLPARRATRVDPVEALRLE